MSFLFLWAKHWGRRARYGGRGTAECSCLRYLIWRTCIVLLVRAGTFMSKLGRFAMRFSLCTSRWKLEELQWSAFSVIAACLQNCRKIRNAFSSHYVIYVFSLRRKCKSVILHFLYFLNEALGKYKSTCLLSIKSISSRRKISLDTLINEYLWRYFF